MTGAWGDSVERACSAGFVKTVNASTNNQIGVYIELDRQHTFLVFNGRIDDLVFPYFS